MFFAVAENSSRGELCVVNLSPWWTDRNVCPTGGECINIDGGREEMKNLTGNEGHSFPVIAGIHRHSPWFQKENASAVRHELTPCHDQPILPSL